MEEKVVVERYGVKMVELGENAAVYVNGERIFEGEFFEAGRVYTEKEREAKKVEKKEYRQVPTATAHWEDVLNYAISMYDAGFHEYPDSEEAKRALAERYRKTMIENGETEIPVLKSVAASGGGSSPDVLSIRGYEVVEKTVAARGTSGGVYVPPSWIGKRVKIVRIDP